MVRDLLLIVCYIGYAHPYTNITNSSTNYVKKSTRNLKFRSKATTSWGRVISNFISSTEILKSRMNSVRLMFLFSCCLDTEFTNCPVKKIPMHITNENSR